MLAALSVETQWGREQLQDVNGHFSTSVKIELKTELHTLRVLFISEEFNCFSTQFTNKVTL